MKWFNFFSDFRPYAPIAIVYFAHVTGSFASALLIFSIFSISTSVFEIPTGVYSDKIGRRKTIVLGSLVSILSIACYAVGGSFWMLVAGAVLAGLQQSLFSGNNDALIYDSLAETNEQHAFHEHLGKINSMFQVGLGVSALFAVFVAKVPLNVIVWLSVIPQVVALLIAFRIVEPTVAFARERGNIYAHLKEAFGKFRTKHKLRNLSLSSVLGFGIGEVVHQFTPAFLSTVWPVWALGIARGMDHALAVVGLHNAGRVLKRFSSFKVLIVGQVLSIGLTLVAVLYPGVWSPILISSTSIPFGFTIIALNALMQAEFSDHQRATMGSINSLFGNIFFAAFAYLFGFVADHLGTRQPIVISQLLLLSVVYLYWTLFKNHRRELLEVV